LRLVPPAAVLSYGLRTLADNNCSDIKDIANMVILLLANTKLAGDSTYTERNENDNVESGLRFIYDGLLVGTQNLIKDLVNQVNLPQETQPDGKPRTTVSRLSAL
jgi:hypothetical protein